MVVRPCRNNNLAIPKYGMTSEPKGTLIAIMLAVGTVAMALLGGVARLLHDTEKGEPITRRDWYKYCTVSVVAGVLLATIAHHLHGMSLLLIGMSGLGGFGAAQILGLAIKTLMALSSKRVLGSEDKKPKRGN